MNTKLTAIVVSLLTVLATVAPAMAPDFGVIVTPPNNAPRIYLVKWCADIGQNSGFSGGCPINDLGSGADGTPNPTNLRMGNYLFTGEQIGWKVVIRDPDGVQDISYAKVIVDGGVEALCQDMTAIWTPQQGAWTNQIPAVGTIPAGFQPQFDKLYKCILTVEPSWYGLKRINIRAYDQSGSVSTDAIAQDWFMNPAITVDLTANDGSSSIKFGSTQGAGNTVMSTNKLIITNNAEGNVDLYSWISMNDLTGSAGALCPISNILDVDTQVEYRGNIGTIFGGWQQITNPSAIDGCNFGSTCLGARGIVNHPVALDNIIKSGAHAEIQFRLTFPVPCIGTFDNPTGIHVIIRAI